MLFCKSLSKSFIEQYALKKVLIAFSGGPDSQALLYTLLELGDLEIGVAHVDHGWREESQREAEALREQVQALKLPFYLKKLAINQSGNLEQICRDARYAFFADICRAEGYQAVFLGHHRDDMAETVLKRVLEGASLTALGGMQKSTCNNGLLILRPFLEIPKIELLNYVKEKNIPYIEDRTNENTKFLRARMRKEILPDLSSQFGKSVDLPLLRLAKECRDLDDFMSKRFSLELKMRGFLDLTALETFFEVRWLIRTWLKRHDLAPSFAVLDDMADLIIKKMGNRQFLLSKKTIEVDRGRLFLREIKEDTEKSTLLLTDGRSKWGPWNVQVESSQLQIEVLGWQHAWAGRLELHLPNGKFYLQSYYDLGRKDRKILQKLWSEEKIPAFFREYVPVISQENGSVRDLLLAKRRKEVALSQKVMLYLET